MLVEKRVRNSVASQLPTYQSLVQNPVHCINFDAGPFLSEENKKFQSLVSQGDIDGLVDRYNIATTGGLAAAAKLLGFDNREKYESAVRKLLVDNEVIRDTLRQRLS